MIPIRSVCSLNSVLSKNKIYEKTELQSLQSSVKHRDREIEIVDNLLGSGQSVYELCAVVNLDPKTAPILFMENILLLQQKNKQMEQYHKESQLYTKIN